MKRAGYLLLPRPFRFLDFGRPGGIRGGGGQEEILLTGRQKTVPTLITPLSESAARGVVRRVSRVPQPPKAFADPAM